MGRASNKSWSCPFYQWADDKGVRCEGKSRVMFPDRKTFSEYANRFCANVKGWEKCSVAQGLMNYYDDQEDRERRAGGAKENRF